MDLALAGTPAQAIELGRRQRAVRLLSEIILLTEQRLRQEELRQALTFSNVQVIDPPALRWKPVWPRRTLGLAVGLMLATGAGLLSLAATERADRRVRRAARIEALLGAPVIAVVVARRGRAPVLTEAEISVIASRAGDDAGHIRVASAGGDRRSAAHVRAIATEEVETTGEFSPRFVALPPIDGFAAAAVAAGPPVVMVVSCGHTRGDALARSVHLMRAAGAGVAGAIVVCSHEAQAAAIWT